MKVIGPAYGEALQANCPSLVAQLAAALAAREADRPPEPGLAMTKPDGPLARLEPLVN